MVELGISFVRDRNNNESKNYTYLVDLEPMSEKRAKIQAFEIELKEINTVPD